MDEPPQANPRYLVPASLGAICARARDAGELVRAESPLRWSAAAPASIDCAPPRYVDDPAQRRFFFGKPLAEFDRRYTFPPPFLCALPAASLVGAAHAIVVAPRYLVTESYRSREVLERDATFRAFERSVEERGRARNVTLVEMQAPPPGRRLQHTALLLSQYWHFNHHHWLIECLPRIRWCTREPGLADAPIIGPPAPGPLQQDTMRILGIDKRVLEFDAGHWRCDRLLFPSPGSFAPDELAWLRRHLAGSESWTLGSQPGERLYVSRSLTDRRRVRNEQEVASLLRRHGFTVVHPETEPLQRQIERFSKARIIAGAHGSGLTNALFAPDDALLLELAPDDRVNHCYWVLASSLGQRYAFLAGRVVNDARDFDVPVEMLERLLEECG